MSALVEFLLERLSEDEESANGLTHAAPVVIEDTERGPIFGWPRYTRERVLAEADAKRRIIELAASSWHGSDCTECNEAGYLGDAVLRLLAAVYQDHPSYRPEWAPE